MSSYWLAREGQKYGPYPLEQLQQMISNGQTASTDSVWQEGMSNWIPISQVVSPSATPQFVPPNAGQAPPFVPGFGIPQTSGLSPTSPRPPSLHWALVIVLGMFTLGLFTIIWILVQSSFVAKLERRSGPVILAILAIISWGFEMFFWFGSIVAVARGEVPASGASCSSNF